MTLGEKLIQYRALTGLPQHVLARALGVSLPTYARVESGARTATGAEVAGFARFSGIDGGQLSDHTQPLPDPLPQLPSVPRVSPGRPAKQPSPDGSFRGKQIASRIRQLINRVFDGNARDFAQAVMVDETMLSGYLNGKREITDRLLLKIVRNLPGISIAWLRVGAGEMNRELSPADHPAADGTPERHDGKQLEAFLLARGLYWVDLQKAMGLSSLSSAVEYKKRGTIRHDTKARIAAALHVTVADIFG